MSYADYTTDEIVERGEALYAQSIRAEVEAENQGKYLVIDIETGEYGVGDNYSLLADHLHAKRPDAPLYMMRIGYPALGRKRTVRITRLEEQGRETDLQLTTPAERLDMMWQLALDTWAFMGEPVAEPRLPRHIVRVLR